MNIGLINLISPHDVAQRDRPTALHDQSIANHNRSIALRYRLIATTAWAFTDRSARSTDFCAVDGSIDSSARSVVRDNPSTARDVISRVNFHNDNLLQNFPVKTKTMKSGQLEESRHHVRSSLNPERQASACSWWVSKPTKGRRTELW